AHLETPNTIIIDSRGAEGFAKGSIPGSINIPIGVSHSGAAVQNVEALAAALEANGVTPEHQLILTCGPGNVASNQLAALRDLGYDNLVLYDGSWEEWGNDPATPKAAAAGRRRQPFDGFAGGPSRAPFRVWRRRLVRVTECVGLGRPHEAG